MLQATFGKGTLSQEELLRSLLASMPTAVALLDRNLHSLLFSQRWLEVYGLTEQEAMGRSLWDLFPHLSSTGKALCRRCLAGATETLTEKRIEQTNGTFQWLQWEVRPWFSHAGEIDGLLVSIEDITERKRTEEALNTNQTERQQAEDLLAGQNHVLELVAQGTPLATILDVLAQLIESQTQQMYCSFLLLDDDGKRLRHGAAPSLPESYNQLVDGIEIGPTVGSCGTAAYCKTSVIVEDIASDPLWANFRDLALSYGLRACWSTPILSSENQVLATFAMYHPYPHTPTSRDRELVYKATHLARIAIERHQAEVALKKANTALEKANEVLELRVVERTQELWTAIARLQKEISDRKQAETSLRQSEAQLRQQAEQLTQTVQELQQTQAQLVQTEKMSSLGRLVAGVAHEINNPVSFIYGNLKPATEYIQDLFKLLELYQQHYPHPNAEIAAEAEAIDIEFLLEDLPKLLDSMKIGAERIQQIVQSLKTFSRMDEGEVKQVNIHEGIDSTLMILQHRLKETGKHAGIQTIKEYGDLPLVECYAGQLNQVFMNILSNAIDALDEYNRERSPAAIKENPATIKISTEILVNQRVRIRIADNGPGMTEAVRQRIFEPFYTTKSIGKGTGLGLSISYQVIVERHRGDLRCISSPRNGAEFLIEIPILETDR